MLRSGPPTDPRWEAAHDAERFPRTARKAYYVGLEDHKRMDALVATGFATAIIYHSHPDAGAYFFRSSVGRGWRDSTRTAGS